MAISLLGVHVGGSCQCREGGSDGYPKLHWDVLYVMLLFLGPLFRVVFSTKSR